MLVVAVLTGSLLWIPPIFSSVGFQSFSPPLTWFKAAHFSASSIADRWLINLGDRKVSRYGRILVAHDERVVLPIFVMHYSGDKPCQSYRSNLFQHPLIAYIHWWLLLALIVLGVALATYIVTGAMLTFSWFFGWGRLSEMSFFEYVFTGGTSTPLYGISFLHYYGYIISRAFFYCLVWKGIRTFLLSIIWPTLVFIWTVLPSVPIMSAALTLLSSLNIYVATIAVIGLTVFLMKFLFNTWFPSRKARHKSI